MEKPVDKYVCNSRIVLAPCYVFREEATYHLAGDIRFAEHVYSTQFGPDLGNLPTVSGRFAEELSSKMSATEGVAQAGSPSSDK